MDEGTGGSRPAGMIRWVPAGRPPRCGGPALFIDRDGVINRRVVGGYVTDPADLEVIDVAIPAIRAARRAGAAVIVVSNQGALARGLLDVAGLNRVLDAMAAELERRAAAVDAVYCCPHHPAAPDPRQRRCGCRKPEPGLLLQAADDLDTDLSRSVMVGDQPSDTEAAKRAGLAPARIFTVDERTSDPAGLARAVARALGHGRDHPGRKEDRSCTDPPG